MPCIQPTLVHSQYHMVPRESLDIIVEAQKIGSMASEAPLRKHCCSGLHTIKPLGLSIEPQADNHQIGPLVPLSIA